MPKPTRRRTFNFLRLSSDFNQFMVPPGGPTDQLFRLGPFGDPLAGPGSPKDPQGHQNDTQIDKIVSQIAQT